MVSEVVRTNTCDFHVEEPRMVVVMTEDKHNIAYCCAHYKMVPHGDRTTKCSTKHMQKTGWYGEVVTSSTVEGACCSTLEEMVRPSFKSFFFF